MLLVLSLQLFQLSQNVSVSREHLSQLHKSPHDDDVHQHGPLGLENTGKHRHALLCESVGRSPSSASLFCSCRMQEQRLHFLNVQLKHEVFRKADLVTTHGQVQVACSDAVELG